MQTKKCHADANANANANRIRTKNNMSPSSSVGDITSQENGFHFHFRTDRYGGNSVEPDQTAPGGAVPDRTALEGVV